MVHNVSSNACDPAGALVDLLEDEFDCVRCAALQACAALAKSRPALASLGAELQAGLLSDDVPAVRCAALAALKLTLAVCGLGGDTRGLLRSLCMALDDSNTLVRQAAVAYASSRHKHIPPKAEY
jgi:hypothetical protein